jgi:hypothetical protein
VGPEAPVLCRNRGIHQRLREIVGCEVHAARAIARQRLVQRYTQTIDDDRGRGIVEIHETRGDRTAAHPDGHSGDTHQERDQGE